MTDSELQAGVTAELDWDPKVDSDDIAVTVDDGAVTLRGTVSSLRQKNQARNAAERIGSIASVSNQLQVRVLNCDWRADAGRRPDGLHGFMLDSLIPRQRGRRGS
jgi:BON domain